MNADLVSTFVLPTGAIRNREVASTAHQPLQPQSSARSIAQRAELHEVSIVSSTPNTPSLFVRALPRSIASWNTGDGAGWKGSTMMKALMPYLLVGLGGFMGANMRFIIARWTGAAIETRFPLGTFVINVSGSFLLGIIGTIVARKLLANSDEMRLALGIGFLGAFTTFSTFEFETHALFEDGEWLTALTNIFLSLFLGLLAVRAGIVLARTWLDGGLR